MQITFCPFKTTLCFLLLHNKLKTSQDMRFSIYSKIVPSSYILLMFFDTFTKTLLTPNPWLTDLYILWVTDNSWLASGDLGLKPDIFCENRPFLTKKTGNISLNFKHSRILSQIGSNKTGWYFSKQCLPVFLWTGTTLPFFFSDRETPINIHSLKINFNGLQIYFLQNFNIQMLVKLWLCALFAYSCWIILNILLLENLMVERRFPVK